MSQKQTDIDSIDYDGLYGIAETLKRGSWFQCSFETISENQAIAHMPNDIRVDAITDMKNSLRNHITFTHIDEKTIFIDGNKK